LVIIIERLSHYYTPPNTFIVSDKFLAMHDQQPPHLKDKAWHLALPNLTLELTDKIEQYLAWLLEQSADSMSVAEVII